jgi:tRNA U34 5-methylaminomethyl-2-thiouridine-forming methyltransferase MnmC
MNCEQTNKCQTNPNLCAAWLASPASSGLVRRSVSEGGFKMAQARDRNDNAFIFLTVCLLLEYNKLSYFAEQYVFRQIIKKKVRRRI